MFIETIPVGVFQCNCTVVACEATRKAIVVDPGDEPERILEIVCRHSLDVVLVMHSHAHIDHIMGTIGIVEYTGAPARLHAGDRRLWEHVDWVAGSYGIPTPRTPPLSSALADGEVIPFGRERIRVIHTPGHTVGSCCFALTLDNGTHVLLSGDTLLRGTIGVGSPRRRSNTHLIAASIRNRLLTFDDDTRVIPGHGPETRIGVERYTNPFLRGA